MVDSPAPASTPPIDRPRIALVEPSGGAPLYPGDWPDASGQCPACGPGPVRPWTVCLQCHRGDPEAEAFLAAKRRRAFLGSVGKSTPEGARREAEGEGIVILRLDALLRRHGGQLPPRLRLRVAVGCPDLGGPTRFDWSPVACPAFVGRWWLLARGQWPDPPDSEVSEAPDPEPLAIHA